MAAPRTNIGSLRFPRDNPGDYEGRIRFTFIKVTPANVDNAVDFVGSLAGFEARNTPDGNGNSTPTIADTGITGERREELSGGITLYLPQGLSFTDGLEYDNNVELGIIGGAINSAIRSGGSLGDAGRATVNAIGGSISDLTGSFTGSDTSRVALSRLTRVGPQNVRDAVSSGLRLTPNPNRRTLFRSVRPREFTFQFTMIANSPDEALEIDRIINRFRFEMYPDVVEGADGVADFVAYEYPSMVNINLSYNNNQVATKLLSGYIVNLQTTYNPSSMGYHVDGKPSEVQLQVTFYEERPLDRRDIAGGY